LKRFLQITAIVALTIFFVWLFLRNANLADVWKILKTTNLIWLSIALIVNLGALLLRTIRWRTILDPDDPPPFYATFFANTVGYMLSTILPIRAADVARPALLARRTSHRFSGALGTVLTERVLDLFTILLLFIYFAAMRWNEFSHDPLTARWFFVVKAGAIASAVLLVALGSLMVGLFFFRPTIRRMHVALGRIIPARFRDSWMHFFDTFTETLEITKHRQAFVKVVMCTAGVWACLTGQFYFTVRALHHPLPYDASIFVTGVTTVGLAIPTPGGVGGFHKACQLVLTRFYGFDIDLSVATAVVFHIVGTIPVITTGLLLIGREGMRWRDVTTPPDPEEPGEGSSTHPV
jgi:glycosyltransferase 2 family protein